MSNLKIGLLAIGTFVLIAALAIGTWAFRVATSDIKGRGDQIIQKNSATNRTGAQERFEDLYQEVLSADARVLLMAGVWEANPSTVNQTNLTGAISYCLDVIGDYNAEARKVSRGDFRAMDLPAQIDTTNTSTDCAQEATR